MDVWVGFHVDLWGRGMWGRNESLLRIDAVRKLLRWEPPKCGSMSTSQRVSEVFTSRVTRFSFSIDKRGSISSPIGWYPGWEGTLQGRASRFGAMRRPSWEALVS